MSLRRAWQVLWSMRLPLTMSLLTTEMKMLLQYMMPMMFITPRGVSLRGPGLRRFNVRTERASGLRRQAEPVPKHAVPG